MERINFEKAINDHAYIAHFVLEAEKGAVDAVIAKEGYNINDIEIAVTLNGFPVRVENFEKLVSDYVDRTVAEKLEQMGHGAFERRVKEEVKSKLYDLVNKIEWEDY